MEPNRKPRADSILDTQLTDARRAELRDMMLSGASHAECKAWLLSSCSVVVKSGDTLTNFYKRHCAPVVAERRKFSVVKAEAFGDAMEADPMGWDAKIVERTKQLTFEFLAAENPDPETVKNLLDALTKANKQQLDRDKFEEMRRKALQADEAAKVSGDGTMNAAQKEARMKEIFGF